MRGVYFDHTVQLLARGKPLMKLRLITMFLSFIYADISHAYYITQNNCYYIDGPANIRSAPNGKLVTTLKDQELVRVIDSFNESWYLIEYSIKKDSDNCDLVEFSSKAWTYYKNLLPPSVGLHELVSNNKLMYALGATGLYGESKISFLGEEYEYRCKDHNCQLIFEKPFEVTVYCLNGSSDRNRISNVYLEYGGDQDAWLGDIRYEQDITTKGCIIIDGALNSSQTKTSSTEFRNLCQECNSNTCSYQVGDLNNDGLKEAIVYTNRPTPVPSYEGYELYQLKSSCEGYRLGNISSILVP